MVELTCLRVALGDANCWCTAEQVGCRSAAMEVLSYTITIIAIWCSLGVLLPTPVLAVIIYHRDHSTSWHSLVCLRVGLVLSRWLDLGAYQSSQSCVLVSSPAQLIQGGQVHGMCALHVQDVSIVSALAPAYQSSTFSDGNGTADKAVDNNKNQSYTAGHSCTATSSTGLDLLPWWYASG
jgi:hypothetical protein